MYIPDPIELLEAYQESFINGDKIICSFCNDSFESKDIVAVDVRGTPSCLKCLENGDNRITKERDRNDR